MTAPRSSPLYAAAILLYALGCCASGQNSEPGMVFTRHPQQLTAPLGDEVELECSLNLAAEKFVWRHKALRSYEWVLLESSNAGGKTSKYVVNFEDESKAGDYRCIAFYGTSGLASDPARLTLARIDRFSDKSHVHLRVPAGNNVPISCPVPHSVPEAIIAFFKDDLPLQNTSITGNKVMIVERAKATDAGNYHCQANNYITFETYTSNHKTILSVDKNTSDQQPYFIKQPQNEYKVQRGHNATLECFAVAAPVPQVKWTKLGSSLPPRSSVSTMGLTLVNVQPADRGEYDCVWTNRAGRIKSAIILTVVEPPSVNRGPKLSTFAEGGEADISCSVTGYPAPHVEWLINGETLRSNKNVQIKGSNLYISPVEKKHAGIVQCVASNEYGSHSGYNYLRVSPKQHMGGGSKSRNDHGKPNNGHKHTRVGGRRRGKNGKRKNTDVMVPPNQPNVTRLSDMSVMVRWSVPENHGLPILFFKVQYRELGQKPNSKQAKWMTANTEIPSHVRSFEVTELQAERTYRFRIAAVYSNNDNAVSPISARFHLTRRGDFETNTMPIPLLTHSEALSPTEVLLLWQNTNKSAEIDGFYVYHRASTSAGDYIKTTVEGRNATNITISHLQTDAMYEFKVQSFSVGAASEFSQILRQKTRKIVTEAPIPQVLAENKVNPVESARNTNLYAIIGGVLGGVILLSAIAAIGVAYKRSKRKQSRESSQDQGINGKPITNGRVMNGGITDSKINITSNPLAGLESTDDPMQPKTGNHLNHHDHHLHNHHHHHNHQQLQSSSMEMSSFLNGQNNNGSCGGAAATAAGGSNNAINSIVGNHHPHYHHHQPLGQHPTAAATTTTTNNNNNNHNGSTSTIGGSTGVVAQQNHHPHQHHHHHPPPPPPPQQLNHQDAANSVSVAVNQVVSQSNESLTTDGLADTPPPPPSSPALQPVEPAH